MKTSRRGFLQAAGLTLVGGSTAVTALAEIGTTKSSKEAMHANRWALVIDLGKCEKHKGCTICKDACDIAHNIPHMPDPKHEIKWIWKEPFEDAIPDHLTEYSDERLKEQEVLVLCNHCEKPPCVRVCPTQATFCREDGLVIMDPHRCIGCRYCIVGCPYGSRSFNWFDPWPRGDAEHPWPNGKPPTPTYPTRVRGVVEKCTFCPERLAKGELPVCVEACAKAGIGAMTFGDVEDPNSEVRRLVQSTDRTVLRRKPGLGTHPQVYYLV